jgi:hypothetical protein
MKKTANREWRMGKDGEERAQKEWRIANGKRLRIANREWRMANGGVVVGAGSKPALVVFGLGILPVDQRMGRWARPLAHTDLPVRKG